MGDSRGCRAAVAAVLIGGVIVASVGACTGGSSVGPTPSVSASPTLPAPMPSPAKPTAWSDNGEQGAAAAAVWFVRELYPYVRETNDATDWQALSAPGCEFCQSTIDDARTQANLGQVSREGVFTVAVTRTEELNPLAYSVLVNFDKPPTTVYRLDGELVTRTEGAHGQILLVLHREGPNWLLRAGQWFAKGAEVPSALSTP